MCATTWVALSGTSGTSIVVLTVPAPQAGPSAGNAYSPQAVPALFAVIAAVRADRTPFHWAGSADTERSRTTRNSGRTCAPASFIKPQLASAVGAGPSNPGTASAGPPSAG